MSKRRRRSEKRTKTKSNSGFFLKVIILATVLLGLIWLYQTLNFQLSNITPATPINTSVWNLYQNTQGGYLIRYPDDWSYREVPLNLFDASDRKNLISYSAYSKVYKTQPDFGKDSLETPNGDPRIAVSKADGKTLIKIVHEQIVAWAKASYKLKDEGTRVIDGADAMYTVSATEVADPNLSDFNYYWIKNGRLYNFSYRSPSQQPLEIPEAILATFRFAR